jgi:hypothetical protein
LKTNMPYCQVGSSLSHATRAAERLLADVDRH